MQFQMPRFLDIEDKVIGPLTFKQFIFLGGGGGLAYVAYTYLGWTWGFVFIALFAGLGISLAFWKPNSRPAIVMLQAFLKHYTKNRMYVWQRPTVAERNSEKKVVEEVEKVAERRNYDHNKIESLSWSLDIMDRELPIQSGSSVEMNKEKIEDK